jgi:hypothetical protein
MCCPDEHISSRYPAATAPPFTAAIYAAAAAGLRCFHRARTSKCHSLALFQLPTPASINTLPGDSPGFITTNGTGLDRDRLDMTAVLADNGNLILLSGADPED